MAEKKTGGSGGKAPSGPAAPPPATPPQPPATGSSGEGETGGKSGRKAWVKKTPVEHVLDQIKKQEEKVNELRDEPEKRRTRTAEVAASEEGPGGDRLMPLERCHRADAPFYWRNSKKENKPHDHRIRYSKYRPDARL